MNTSANAVVNLFRRSGAHVSRGTDQPVLPQRRRPALDGLRGLAALVVVFAHVLLVAPSLAGAVRGDERAPTGSWPWLLAYTPLHLFWAGGEAVLIFFVLSGLVLALPMMGGSPFPWRSYYPQRLVRLYVPVVAAVVLAMVQVALVPRHAPPTSSWWIALHTSPITLKRAVRDALLITGTSGLNTAFWSLKWEVVFSLLLPLFLIIIAKIGSWRLSFSLLSLVILASCYSSHVSLLYMPIFCLGILTAKKLPQLDAFGAHFNTFSRTTRSAIALGGCLLLTVHWWMPPIVTPVPPAIARFCQLQAILIGACVLIWMFTSTTMGTALGTYRPIAWLGKRSFSLYLVHEPIVVTTTYVFHGTTNAGLVLLVALPVSLAVAEIFGRLCEQPSHRLAKAVGRRCAATGPSVRG